MDGFVKRASAGSVKASFSYVGGGMTMDGDILICGECFRMDVSGLEVWCDGEHRWTIDRDAKEVCKEDVGEAAGAVYDTQLLPLVMSDPYGLFNIAFSGTVERIGVKRYEVVLTPKFDTDIAAADLYFDHGDLKSIVMTTAGGLDAEVRFSSLEFAPACPKEGFTFSDKSLGKDWIVTEL